VWVFTEDGTAAVNLDHCFLILIRVSEAGVGIMAYRDRGDMGTLLKVVDTEAEAHSFVNGLLASSNSQTVYRKAGNSSGVRPAWDPPSDHPHP
jgi:hypothetical protein